MNADRTMDDHGPGVAPPRWPEDIADDLTRLETELVRAGAARHGFLTAVKDVVSRETSLAYLFAQTAWGRIVWRRAVGQPVSPRMADAFTIRHQYEEIDGEIGPNGTVVRTSRLVDGAPPRLWDGPHDDEYYRVSYIVYARHPWYNGVGVELNTSVSWGPPLPPWFAAHRRIVYPDSLLPFGLFRVPETGITVLEDIHVERRFDR